MRGLPRHSAAFIFAVVFLGACVVGTQAHAASGGPEKKYLIRHAFREGRKLKYRLEVEADAEWRPRQEGRTWGEVDTDFTFLLTGKTVRENGSCTFDLSGKKLMSKVRGPKGTVSVSATPSRFKISTPKGKVKIRKENPLTKPMTATIGPRGAFLYGTGLFPVLPFFRVPVDRIAWHILTVAPPQEVGKGDRWERDFDVRLPDSIGKPLHVVAKARVAGWREVGGRRCLVIRLEGRAALKNTTVTLKNGDRLFVKRGTYEVEGAAMWDVKNGLLCSAEAACALKLISTKPSKAAWHSRGRVKLRLLSAD